MAIKVKLRELRAAHGLTQGKLAACLGIRQATVSDLEQEPDPTHFKRLDTNTLSAICRFFMVPIEDVLEYHEPEGEILGLTVTDVSKPMAQKRAEAERKK